MYTCVLKINNVSVLVSYFFLFESALRENISYVQAGRSSFSACRAINIIGWIYKQEPIMFNRLASRLDALPIWTRPLATTEWVEPSSDV